MIYTLTSPRTFDIEKKFRQWVEADAYRALLPHRELLGPAEFFRQADGWRQDLGKKLYAWGQPACVEALWSPEGVEEMAYMQFVHAQQKAREAGEKPPEMTREILVRICKDKVKWKELTDLVLELKPDPADPNA